MKTTRLIVTTLVFIIGIASIFFGSSTTAASAPALLGITLTPTNTEAPTATPFMPTMMPTAMPSPTATAVFTVTATATATPTATAAPGEDVSEDDDDDDPLENVVFLPPAGFSGEIKGNLPGMPAFVFGKSTRLMIPGLHVSAPVLGVFSDGYTWDIRGLDASVGWLAETGRPSRPGNVVMVGHVFVENGSPFKDLDQLKPGAEIWLVAGSQQYRYRVTGTQMVDPRDTSVLRSDDRYLLTLITCAQYDAEQKMYLKRLVVTAELMVKAEQTVTAE